MKKKAVRLFLYFTGIVLSIVFTITIFAPSHVNAANFKYTIQSTYTINDNYVLVEESKTITNNSKDRYIPASENTTFFIPKYSDQSQEDFQKTLSSIKTSPSNFTKKEVEGGYEITVPFANNLYSGEKTTFSLQYNDYQIMNIVGNVKNIYFPRIIFPETTGYEISHHTTVRIPVHLSDNIYYNLEPTSKTDTTQYTILNYDKEQISQNNIYIQLGNQQFYHFKITQDIPQTYQPTNGLQIQDNKIQLLLPKEYDETNQKVYIESWNPEPTRLYKDSEENIVAEYILSATQSHKIEIQGYITISLEQSQTIPSFITKKQLSFDPHLVEHAEFWEVNSNTIKEAINYVPESENIIEQIYSTYEYVVDKLEYDHDKINNNIRFGAEATLQGSPAVCMEYADTMIALLRAQGIPARAAFGRGFNTNLTEEEQEDHQWVQALIPDYGWITIDPTWGENNRIYIGADLDHVLWYTSEKSPTNITPLKYIISDSVILNAPEIKFTPLEQEISSTLESTNNISFYLEKNKKIDEGDVSQYVEELYNDIRISQISRIVDQFLPLWIITALVIIVIVVIVILWVLSAIIKFIFKRKK